MKTVRNLKLTECLLNLRQRYIHNLHHNIYILSNVIYEMYNHEHKDCSYGNIGVFVRSAKNIITDWNNIKISDRLYHSENRKQETFFIFTLDQISNKSHSKCYSDWKAIAIRTTNDPRIEFMRSQAPPPLASPPQAPPS